MGIGAAALIIVGSTALLFRRSAVVVHRMERRLSLPDLVKGSDLILEGTLKSKSTHSELTATSEQLMYTDWIVKPNHVLKGIAPTPLVVSVLGGEQGDIHLTVPENTASLQADAQYLMFVDYRVEGNHWDLSALRQSVFRNVNGIYENAAGDSYRQTDVQSEVAKNPEITLPISGLANQAELTVYGTLAKGTVTHHTTVSGEERPYTFWAVQSPVVWKGSVTDPLVMSIMGGQLGTSWYPNEVRADLRNGLAALMYLQKDTATGEWRLVSADHGFFLKTGDRYYDMHGTGYTELQLRAALPSGAQ